MGLKTYNSLKINKLNLILIIIVLFIILYIIYTYFHNYKNETFDVKTPTTTNSVLKIPIDRTKLYGSLFIDNLDEQIKDMTDPDIKYEEKRNELNKYSDILL